jgi:hypothetical protein
MARCIDWPAQNQYDRKRETLINADPELKRSQIMRYFFFFCFINTSYAGRPRYIIFEQTTFFTLNTIRKVSAASS